MLKGGQGGQEFSPSPEYDPAAQKTQGYEDAPKILPYVPAAHGMHEGWPIAGWYEPGEQVWQEAGGSENLPAGHEDDVYAHEAAPPEVLYAPSGQAVQEAGDAANVPAGHDDA